MQRSPRPAAHLIAEGVAGEDQVQGIEPAERPQPRAERSAPAQRPLRDARRRGGSFAILAPRGVPILHTKRNIPSRLTDHLSLERGYRGLSTVRDSVLHEVTNGTIDWETLGVLWRN